MHDWGATQCESKFSGKIGRFESHKCAAECRVVNTSLARLFRLAERQIMLRKKD